MLFTLVYTVFGSEPKKTPSFIMPRQQDFNQPRESRAVVLHRLQLENQKAEQAKLAADRKLRQRMEVSSRVAVSETLGSFRMSVSVINMATCFKDLESQQKEVEAQRQAWQEQMEAQQLAAAQAIMEAQEKAKAEIEQAKAFASSSQTTIEDSDSSPVPIAKRTRAKKVSRNPKPVYGNCYSELRGDVVCAWSGLGWQDIV